ncbi:hypothetical protein [Rhizobium sp. 21-4511-3d]
MPCIVITPTALGLLDLLFNLLFDLGAGVGLELGADAFRFVFNNLDGFTGIIGQAGTALAKS